MKPIPAVLIAVKPILSVLLAVFALAGCAARPPANPYLTEMAKAIEDLQAQPPTAALTLADVDARIAQAVPALIDRRLEGMATQTDTRLTLYREGLKTLLAPVYFAKAANTLAPEAKAAIEKKAEFLKSEPELHLIITGHASAPGRTATNAELARHRAEHVGFYLQYKGVPAERMTIYSRSGGGHGDYARKVTFAIR